MPMALQVRFKPAHANTCRLAFHGKLLHAITDKVSRGNGLLKARFHVILTHNICKVYFGQKNGLTPKKIEKNEFSTNDAGAHLLYTPLN